MLLRSYEKNTSNNGNGLGSIAAVCCMRAAVCGFVMCVCVYVCMCALCVCVSVYVCVYVCVISQAPAYGSLGQSKKLQKRRLGLCATCNMQHDNDNMQFIIEVDTINVNWFAPASVEAAKAHPHGMILPAKHPNANTPLEASI